jgi:SAM-dependent methyltransferase
MRNTQKQLKDTIIDNINVIDKQEINNTKIATAAQDSINDRPEINKEENTNDDLNNIILPEDIKSDSPDYMLYSPFPVGYSTIQEQSYIFENLIVGYTPDLSILDIGCGRADLINFIEYYHGTRPSLYTGIDHNPNILNIAKQKYGTDFKLTFGPFEKLDLVIHDWVVASGIFTARRCESESEDLLKLIDDIDILYKATNQVLAFNLLNPINTTHFEGFFYVHPGLILDMLIEKYQDVVIKHNYSDDVYTVLIYKYI